MRVMRQGGNGITDKGALVLAEALQVNCGVQWLDLVLRGRRLIFVILTSSRDEQYDNRITDKGALALADALRANSSLQWLDLVSNALLCHLLYLHVDTYTTGPQQNDRQGRSCFIRGASSK